MKMSLQTPEERAVVQNVYYEKNKEKLKAQMAANYQANKEKINRQKRDKRKTCKVAKAKSILLNSKTHKLGFGLTLDYVMALLDKQKMICALSGELMTVNGDRCLSNMMSLDRIDSSIGYFEGNVQWVGVKYNLMKSHTSQEEFVQMCKRVAENSYEA